MLAAAASAACPASSVRLIDIGANLLDSQFTKGRYNGGKHAHHAPDLDTVLRRAEQHAVSHIIVTAGELREARAALELCRRINKSGTTSVKLHCTVGVHPTRTKLLDDVPAGGVAAGAADLDESSGPDEGPTHGCAGSTAPPDPQAGPARARQPLPKAEYIAALEEVIKDGMTDGTVVAIGECGLDYDRLFRSPKESQLRHLGFHFDLAEHFGLPMFLHDRNTGGDFLRIIREQRHRFRGGVVHSFTGTDEELASYLALGLDIGINGCSLKTAANVATAVSVPLDRILLETDAPWCEIRRSHASFPGVRTHFSAVPKERYQAALDSEAAAAAVSASAAPSVPAVSRLVKGRSEPCQIVQVAEALASARGCSLGELSDAAYLAHGTAPGVSIT